MSSADWPAFAAILLLGSLAGAAMGLVLGTAVPPNRISVAFAIVLTPLIFTGAAFYPWPSLTRLQWFQDLTLANPMTYVSEGMRASLTGLPHLGSGWIALGAVAAVGIFTGLGVRGFIRRARLVAPAAPPEAQPAQSTCEYSVTSRPAGGHLDDDGPVADRRAAGRAEREAALVARRRPACIRSRGPGRPGRGSAERPT